jgi:dihydropteroate synthase
MRAIFQWRLNSRIVELGRRTLIMGIVNVTPDSFSDGGLYIDAEKAVQHAEQLLDEGADIIDIGGESTRPGTKTLSHPLSEDEELKRVLPVIRDLKRRRPDALISVDTYKASVARAAVEAGAEVVNDVSGFRWDPKMARTLAELKVGAVLMHTRGRPEEWQSLPPIGDSVLTVKRELREFAEAAVAAGMKRDRLVLDPGFGFGKRLEENYPLLARFGDLQQMGFPLLAGISRKGFIGRMLAGDGKNGAQQKDADVSDRLFGTIAAETVLILKGAHIIRTHDVRSAVDAAKVGDAIVASGG